ncbi:hypothetical protein EDC04DRAFT_2605814 [Pisolithus marmoratus]|nr:hypothetical protein EDC04DRAFT_2605814 [Pisolithus marmoratus]
MFGIFSAGPWLELGAGKEAGPWTLLQAKKLLEPLELELYDSDRELERKREDIWVFGQPAVDIMKSRGNLIENIIILEVENLLQDWPVYVINFMAENTGPQNASKYVRIDSDNEDETVVSEHHRCINYKQQCKNYGDCCPTLQYDSPGKTLDEEEMPSSDEDVPKVLPTTTHAVPISLHGTPKEPALLKCKAFDENWPPHRPRAFRKISPDSSIAMYDSFWTFPAAISNGPAGENVEGDGMGKA